MSLATQQYHTIAICVIEIDSKSKKKLKSSIRMVTLSEKIIWWYLPTALGFRSVMLCSNLMIVRAKGRCPSYSRNYKNHGVRKTLLQIKLPQNKKSGVKCCNQRGKTKSQTNYRYLASNTHILPTAENIFLNLKFLRKSNIFLLLGVTRS